MITINDQAALGSTKRAGGNLTNREAQALDLLVRGFSNRQIADNLGVKFYTASTYVKSIYKKLGIHKRSAVVAYVLTRGIRNGPALAPPLAGPAGIQANRTADLFKTVTKIL